MQIRHTAGEPLERRAFRYEPCTGEEYPDGIDFSSEGTARVTQEVGECLAEELDSIEIIGEGEPVGESESDSDSDTDANNGDSE